MPISAIWQFHSLSWSQAASQPRFHAFGPLMPSSGSAQTLEERKEQPIPAAGFSGIGYVKGCTQPLPADPARSRESEPVVFAHGRCDGR